MVGLDLKADVIEKCNQTARKYGYDGCILNWAISTAISLRESRSRDYTARLRYRYGLCPVQCCELGARVILSVPCCQHELNGQIQSEQFSILTRYGIVKERAAALMTDAIRANLLECCGYKTQLLEFIDLAHTPKNILIRAVNARHRRRPRRACSRRRNPSWRNFCCIPPSTACLKRRGGYDCNQDEKSFSAQGLTAKPFCTILK